MDPLDARLVKPIAIMLLAATSLLTLNAREVFAAEDFYKGKQITLYPSGTGSYEAYARLVAKYLPKYIPGEPVIIVKNLSGASGLKAANYIYNNAAKDGTEIAATHGHIPTAPIFKGQGIQYDPTKLGWIGSATKEVYIAYAWNTSPVQSMEEARVKVSTFGGQAVGSMSIDIPILANAMMGTKFNIITGYKGSADERLALLRGELHGVFGSSWTAMKIAEPEWIKEKKIKIIAQFGRTRHFELPDVPLLTDFVIDPEDRKALELYLTRQETGKPYFAPPGVPAERLAILRKAFESALKDPGLRADAQKQTLDINSPMTGPEVEAFVAEISKTPAKYPERLAQLFSSYSAKQ